MFYPHHNRTIVDSQIASAIYSYVEEIWINLNINAKYFAHDIADILIIKNNNKEKKKIKDFIELANEYFYMSGFSVN